MLNFSSAHNNGGSEDESEWKIGGQNVKETYEIFRKIFTLKQISEKIRIHDQKIYMGFVDVPKAFDSIPKKQI